MSYGRYHRQNLEQFLLHRVTRNVLIQHRTADSTHILIGVTSKILSVHYGIVGSSFQVVRSETVLIQHKPELLFVHDGLGFNLVELMCFVEDL